MANSNPSPETRFKPGCAPGPGRPRNDLITKKAIELLLKKHPKLKEKTRLEVHAEKWLDRTENGEGFTELLDRVDGKMPEKTESIVNVSTDTPTEDPELDAWAKERARALADKEARSQAEPSGVRGPDEPGPMAVGSSSGPTE